MKRRILLTTTAYPPSTGGVQAHVAELRARLINFEADVLTLWLRNRTDWLLGTTVRLASDVAQAAPGVTTLGWSPDTRRRMLPWVFSYYWYPALAARQIATQMLPYMETTVRPDHVLIHNHRIGREFLARASLSVARARGMPFVLTPHHHPRWRGRRYGGWIEVYREADAVLALTEFESAELQRLGVSADRIHVIGGAADPPLPADASRFRARIRGTTQPLILFLGQQFEYKGIADLVAATAAIRSRGVMAELAFVGPSTPFSTRYFSRHKEPWLHVLGTVDEQTKWDAIEASTVVCLPSRHEAFGRVYLEAWSKGKPVIGARIPTAREVITDGETGLLVEPGSRDELAAALERLVSDPGVAARLGANGSRAVQGRFSWQHVIGRIEAAYDSALNAAPARRP
ncbi:MAG: glycosyltransferase family 4 protein [Solirubrobacteraceae bacterium]